MTKANWQLLWGRLKYELAAYIGIPLLAIGGIPGAEKQWNRFHAAVGDR
ncbi:MAG: hypothetical protein U0176_18970 [Bacteroidia bacterium]